MLRNKESKHDLRKYYLIFIETGLILALLIMIGAFSYNMSREQEQSNEKSDNNLQKQEVVEVKDVVRTQQAPDRPPSPASPQPPREVPNDEIISEDVQQQLDQIDQQVSSGSKLSIPPPPDKPKEEEQEQIFKVVEKQPQLIGGLDSLRSLIRYPPLAEKAGIEGRVYIEFIINKQGEVEDPKVVRGPGAGLNKEALRVIKKAKFRPGLQQGRPVHVRMTMPIVFRLDESD